MYKRSFLNSLNIHDMHCRCLLCQEFVQDLFLCTASFHFTRHLAQQGFPCRGSLERKHSMSCRPIPGVWLKRLVSRHSSHITYFRNLWPSDVAGPPIIGHVGCSWWNLGSNKIWKITGFQPQPCFQRSPSSTVWTWKECMLEMLQSWQGFTIWLNKIHAFFHSTGGRYWGVFTT